MRTSTTAARRRPLAPSGTTKTISGAPTVPCSGLTFALSTTGVSQKVLAATIASLGGTVSRIVHHRIDFLVATPAALNRNTQAVRKARACSIPLVGPEFLRSAERTGVLGEPQSFPAEAPLLEADDTGASPQQGATLQDVGLLVGSRLEVLVEMSDAPFEQWWPAQVGPAAQPPSKILKHRLTYLELPARGYGEPTPSRAIFETRREGAELRLFDADEELWRPWRLVEELGTAAQAAVGPGRGRSAAAAQPQPSTRRRKGQRRRRWWPYACWWSCALMPRPKRRKAQHVILSNTPYNLV